MGKRFFLRLFLRRLGTVYFFIFIAPFPIGYINHFFISAHGYYQAFNSFVLWTGHHILHISSLSVSAYNGSGDKAFNYVQTLVTIVLAAIIAIAWCIIIIKNKKDDDRILYWLLAYIRFYFALVMMRYGLEKVIKTQFAFPYYSLNETYGESSPMRLMWSFMGYSTAYNIATGMAEILAGLLVVFRRTTLPGILLSIGILSNIVMLNFCFDVPVKLFAVNILLMAVFIATPHAQRLVTFFLFRKTVAATPIMPRFQTKRANHLWLAAKFGLMAWVLYSAIQLQRYKYSAYGDGAFKATPLAGLYRVKTFVKSGDTLAPPVTEATQWKNLTIVYKKEAAIQVMNNSTRVYDFMTDTVSKKIRISDRKDTSYTAAFFYTIPDPQHLSMTGKIKSDSVFILLQKQDLNQYQLINRGFHWINEYPYNK